MNIIIVTDCDTNERKDLLVETIRSLDKFKPYIIGYFSSQIIEQVTQLSRVIAYPKSTSMGYLKLFIEDDNLKDDEMITLIKSGTLLISNPLDIDLDSDGHVGIQYEGLEHCTIDTVHNYIEKNDLKCNPGFSGTAIRVGFLREFFKHYESNETQLLQFIEGLTNVSFLISPNVYRTTSQYITGDKHFQVKPHNIMGKYKLTEQIIVKLKNLGNMIDSLEETQKDLILAYKEKRVYNVSLRSDVFEQLTSEMDQIFEILIENDLI